MSALSLHRVLAALAHHIGREHGVSARELVAEISGDPAPDPAAERALRQSIVELRLRGHHICGHPAEGYYMAAGADELEQTCMWLYDRAVTTLAQIAAMKRLALPDLRGQLKLRT